MIFVCYVRSGWVELTIRGLRSLGVGTHYLSSMPYSMTDGTRVLLFSNTNVTTSHVTLRYGPFPLRCLADQLYIVKGYNIAKAPLYYVRSGFIDLNLGYSRYLAIGGYRWSSRSYSIAAISYSFAFDEADAYPSGNFDRSASFPLRWWRDQLHSYPWLITTQRMDEA